MRRNAGLGEVLLADEALAGLRHPQVGDHELARPHLGAVGEHDAHRPAVLDDGPLDLLADEELPAQVAEGPLKRVRDGVGAAVDDRRRLPRQHQRQGVHEHVGTEHVRRERARGGLDGPHEEDLQLRRVEQVERQLATRLEAPDRFDAVDLRAHQLLQGVGHAPGCGRGVAVLAEGLPPRAHVHP